MRIEDLQELIEIYNEIEPNKSRCIDIEEIMANISDPNDAYEIEQFVGIIIARIELAEQGEF